MKKVKTLVKRMAAVIMSAAIAMGVLMTPEFSKEAHAADTNISMTTAIEIPNNSFVEGAVGYDDPSGGFRWYKFTNPYDCDCVATVTVTASTHNPECALFNSLGGSDGKRGYAWPSIAFHAGLKAGETKYLKVSNGEWKGAWTASVSITPEEGNAFKVAKSYKSGKRINGKLDYLEDVDIYKIKAKKTGVMKFSITNNENHYDVKYTVYNKGKAAKKTGEVKEAETKNGKLKIKKGQYIYIEIKRGSIAFDSELGSYSIKTKIK
ncbi:hypothetical protein [Butyrivibrio sp. JL13D10]|uniref:hypothetical protein n=1 Tax=Butyrivibrio sp. JL13D10 TaxID=3236815 RepID=UPI0038B5FBA0